MSPEIQYETPEFSFVGTVVEITEAGISCNCEAWKGHKADPYRPVEEALID